MRPSCRWVTPCACRHVRSTSPTGRACCGAAAYSHAESATVPPRPAPEPLVRCLLRRSERFTDLGPGRPTAAGGEDGPGRRVADPPIEVAEHGKRIEEVGLGQLGDGRAEPVGVGAERGGPTI